MEPAAFRKKVASHLPRPLMRAYGVVAVGLRYFADCLHDARRFAKFSSMLSGSARQDPAQVAARITAAYHVIEKGMTLPSVRLGYGQPAVAALLDTIAGAMEDPALRGMRVIPDAVAAVASYLRFHEERGHPLPALQEKFASLANRGECGEGGTRSVSKAELRASAREGFESLAHSRFSVRSYSDEPVDPLLVERAIRIAQRSPSVCNRQCVRVHLLGDREAKSSALKLQNGNRGFGETIDTLLVVTSDLRAFFGSGERNQAYVDGGLFSMTLLHALHYLGLGACALNWCVDQATDKKLHDRIGIPENEAVIMFIAVGNLPDRLEVAASSRKPLEEILRLHEAPQGAMIPHADRGGGRPALI